MGFFDVRIVRPVHRSERAVAGNAALEFFLRLLHDGFFEGIGATAENKDGVRQKENDNAGLQARRILKNRKVTSDE